MMLNEDAIRKAISASVYETVGEGAVASVDVEFSDDVEPMTDVVNVRIVVNGDVDRRTVSTLGLTLRRVLTKFQHDLFPLESVRNQIFEITG
jgi:hypothetical protein